MIKIRTVFVLSLIIVTSCNDSSIYETVNSHFKILKNPMTTVNSKIKRLSTNNETIKNEFNFDQLRKVPDYYSGLTPSYPMVTGLYMNKIERPSISLNGGLILTGHCVVIKIHDKYVLIDSPEKAKQYFAPIETKEEAISYLSLVTNSYPIYDFKYVKESFMFKKTIINKTFVDTLSNGYSVHLFEKLIFACEHPYFEVVYDLSLDGTFREISRNEIFRDPTEDGLCID